MKRITFEVYIDDDADIERYRDMMAEAMDKACSHNDDGSGCDLQIASSRVERVDEY